MFVAQTHVRAEGLDMDLYATALALADGDLRIVLLDIDLCFLPDPIAEAVRSAVADATRVRHEDVLPFCSHSHAGPPVLAHYHGEGEDRLQAYITALPHLIAGAAARAMACLTPARFAAGSGHSTIGINRDLRLPDGRYVVGCNRDGFFDPEVAVIRIDTADGHPLACIVNYACHPTVLGPKNKLISPDYPGSTRRIVEEVTKATCVFLQGAAGNVGPRETFVADAEVARRLGTELGLEASLVYLQLKPVPTQTLLRGVIPSGAALAEYEEVALEVPEPRLRFTREVVELPVRSRFAEVYEKAPERLAQSEQRLAELQRQGASQDELGAALQHVTRERLRVDRILLCRGRKTLPVETQVIRLGEAAIVSISGEPYSEVGVEVKSRSPFQRKTLFAGYVGGDMMYIPTAAVFEHQPPPMEVDNSFCAPEAARVATEHLVRLLESVANA